MFEKCRPEDVNVDSRGIIEFLDDCKEKKLHLHKLMILRHGKTIVRSEFAPWSTDDLHMLFSLTKSFTSTAVGFAVQDGLLKVEDRVVDIFPEIFTNEPCENMRKLTVKHLLTMNTGHEEEPEYKGDDWESIFLRSYIPCEPGTHFMYNTAGSYILSAIVQKVTGKKTIDYLKEKLFIPLGMSEDIWSEESPSGVNTGGHGMNVRIDDIAKFGQFLLQKGSWNGVQLLSKEWITDAQTPWSDNSAWVGTDDWKSGYGYQFWMCTPDNVFRGDGAFGQYCIVFPDQDMVIAMNSGVDEMGDILKSLWKYVLPAVDRKGEASDALDERLGRTGTPTDWEENGGDASDPVPEKAWEGSYRLGSNPLELTRVDLKGENITFTDSIGRSSTFALRRDEWIKGRFEPILPRDKGYYDIFSAKSARIGDKLIVHICYTLTPFEDVLTFSFTEHGVIINGRRNVGFPDNGKYEILGYRQ